MAIDLTGDLGAIRYGYHTVAQVQGWRVAGDDGTRVLTGTVEDVNEVMASQQPLTFQAERARGVSRWPIVTLEITGASVRAVLGPREIT
jgi:hypothetical protein